MGLSNCCRRIHEPEKRRKLCKDHDIPCNRSINNSNKDLDAGMEYIRRELTNRIHQIRTTTKSNNLEKYFTHMPTGSSFPQIKAFEIPDVATDVDSTYLRLHQKRHTYAEDKDFTIVRGALYELSGYVGKQRLRELTRDPRKTGKTIRQYFKERNFGTINFLLAKAPAEATGADEENAARCNVTVSHTWKTYYVKLGTL